MSRKTATEVIKRLKEVFSRLGVPEEIVSDNVPFSSAEFRAFGKEWDIVLTTSSPNYPQSNGMAENAVGIAKSILRRASTGRAELTTMLLDYRNTPVKGMSVSPAQLCAGRRLRTKLPVITSKLSLSVPRGVERELEQKQLVQKLYYDRTARTLPELSVGDKVLLKHGKTLETAKVTAHHPAPRSFIVTTADGTSFRRTRSHLVKPKHDIVAWVPEPQLDTTVPPQGSENASTESVAPTETVADEPPTTVPRISYHGSQPVIENNVPLGPTLRSRTSIKPPKRFEDFVK